MHRPATTHGSFQLGFCYLAVGAGALGIALQQILVGLFAITSMVIAVRLGRFSTGWLFSEGRRTLAVFAVVMLGLSLITHQTHPSPEGFDYHWPVLVYWVITPTLIDGFNWRNFHRTLLIVSVPSLIQSWAHLLQPDEIAHAMNIGFHYFPRAEGFEGNPITHAEGLVLLACWSLARLRSEMSNRERFLIKAHLTIAIGVIIFSRIRSGILALAVLLLMHGLLHPRWRKKALMVISTILILFAVGTLLFGFNTASLGERIGHYQNNWAIFPDSPWFGVGPSKGGQTMLNGIEIPVHPHNTYFGVVIDFGLVGLVFYLAALLTITWQLFQLYRAEPTQVAAPTWVIHALIYAQVHYISFGMFDYNFNDTETIVRHAFHWSMTTILWQKYTRQKPTKP